MEEKKANPETEYRRVRTLPNGGRFIGLIGHGALQDVDHDLSEIAQRELNNAFAKTKLRTSRDELTNDFRLIVARYRVLNQQQRDTRKSRKGNRRQSATQATQRKLATTNSQLESAEKALRALLADKDCALRMRVAAMATQNEAEVRKAISDPTYDGYTPGTLEAKANAFAEALFNIRELIKIARRLPAKKAGRPTEPLPPAMVRELADCYKTHIGRRPTSTNARFITMVEIAFREARFPNSDPHRIILAGLKASA